MKKVHIIPTEWLDAYIKKKQNEQKIHPGVKNELLAMEITAAHIKNNFPAVEMPDEPIKVIPAKELNPYACFGRKPHRMDFDNENEYIARMNDYNLWALMHDQTL